MLFFGLAEGKCMYAFSRVVCISYRVLIVSPFFPFFSIDYILFSCSPYRFVGYDDVCIFNLGTTVYR